MEAVDFDVGIIGGGPAGAAMGCYLAKAGVSCAIFERELFPRPHVGESFVPSSTRIFKELDFLRVMEAHKFPRKYGATWTASPQVRPYSMDWKGVAADCQPAAGISAESRADIRFEERAQPGVDQPYTYHVDRGRFDLALLQHANEAGAQVCEGLDVKRVDFRDGGDPDIVMMLGPREIRTRVRLVVDASGRRTLVGSQLKLKIKDPVFDQYALHTWFEGFDRGGVAAESNIHIHFLPLTNTWVWQIPINDSTTSIGVVTQKKNFLGSRQSREAFFWDCLRTREDLWARVERARKVRPLKEEADYSYAMTQFTGDRYLLLGDAARFVDPIFSTGVSIALNSARFASRDVIAALANGGLSRGAFRTFESTMKRGVKNWYNFITVYYRLNVLFTHFVQSPAHRLDVLKLLQGDVYDEEPPAVLSLMRQKVDEVEQSPKHMWHRVLGDLTANAFREAAHAPPDLSSPRRAHAAVE
jgi:1H-pyrrole-2-carbonyl-[peptidyl-carrier protein] chlorinase